MPTMRIARRSAALTAAGLVAAALASGCAVPIKVAVDQPGLAKVHRIMLMPPAIGRLQQPAFPLLDAGVARARTNGICADIVAAEQSVVPGFAVPIARRLRGDLGLDVVDYREVDAEDRTAAAAAAAAGRAPDARFPTVCDRGLDPLGLGRKDLVRLDEVELGDAARQYCARHGVDAIAVSFSALEVVRTDLILGSDVRLDSWLHVVDAAGHYVIRARFHSDSVEHISPADPAGFARALARFDDWTDRMFDAVVGAANLSRGTKDGSGPP